MNQAKVLNVANDLRGMMVIEPVSARELGRVADVIVHPTRGQMIGIALRNARGEERVISSDELEIGLALVMADEKSLRDPQEFNGGRTGGAYVCRDILGVKVVTVEGRLLGRVGSVDVLAQRAQIVYHVAESKVKKFLGGGFTMAGSTPQAYSKAGARLIVPADTEDRRAIWWLTNPPWRPACSGRLAKVVHATMRHALPIGLTLAAAMIALLLLW